MSNANSSNGPTRVSGGVHGFGHSCTVRGRNNQDKRTCSHDMWKRKGKQGTGVNKEPENLTKRGETGKQGSQKENTGCCAVRRRKERARTHSLLLTGNAI